MRRARHAPPTADAGSLDAEEYLDRCGVTAYMKDCVTLLLENRPDEPLTFMGDYFRTVTQPSSPLLRAYRYIRLAPIDRPSFPDNLVAAYAALDSQRGTNGVTGAELQRLLAVLRTDSTPSPNLSPSPNPSLGLSPDPEFNQIICADFPVDVSHSLLATVGKRDVDLITFEVALTSTPTPTPTLTPAPTLTLDPTLTLTRSSPPPCARPCSTRPSSAGSATPLPRATSVARAMRTRRCLSWSGARCHRHPTLARLLRRLLRRLLLLRRRRRRWSRKMTRGDGRRWAAGRARRRPGPISIDLVTRSRHSSATRSSPSRRCGCAPCGKQGGSALDQHAGSPEASLSARSCPRLPRATASLGQPRPASANQPLEAASSFGQPRPASASLGQSRPASASLGQSAA